MMSWLRLKSQQRNPRGSHEHNATDDAVPTSAQTATQWDIINEAKFDKLLQVLRDFIEDLEAMTRRLDISRHQRIFVDAGIESISEITTLQTIEAARVEPNDPISDSASQRLLRLRGSSNREASIAAQSSKNSGPHTFVTAPSQVLTAVENPENTGSLSMPILPQLKNCMQDLEGSTGTDILEQTPESCGQPQNKRKIAGMLSGDETAQRKRSKEANIAAPQPFPSSYRQAPWSTFGIIDFEKFNKEAAEVLRQLVREMEDRPGLFTVAPVNDNLTDLIGSFQGPPGTPYQGGIFRLSIQIRSDFRLRPLNCRFVTRVYHPNIDANGNICPKFL
jgi:Ubiquitin-conjugating enzyme/Prion-inhibition and propagation